jgi:hypothetical protein
VANVVPVILVPSSSKRPSHPNIIVTEAHRLVDDGMSIDDWRQVWKQAWEEIPHLVKDIQSRMFNTARKLA